MSLSQEEQKNTQLEKTNNVTENESCKEKPQFDNEFFKQEKNEALLKWMDEQLDKDIQKIKMQGSSPNKLKCKNFSTIRKGKELWNRIEFDESLNFSLIQQILVSDNSIQYQNQNLYYITVILISKNEASPYILPYIYTNIEKTESAQETQEQIEKLKADNKNTSEQVPLTKNQKKKQKKKLKKKIDEIAIIENKLNLWIFINNQFQEFRHKVQQFS